MSAPHPREHRVEHAFLMDTQINDAIGISQALSGPLGLCVVVGYLVSGVPGALAPVMFPSLCNDPHPLSKNEHRSNRDK